MQLQILLTCKVIQFILPLFAVMKKDLCIASICMNCKTMQDFFQQYLGN